MVTDNAISFSAQFSALEQLLRKQSLLWQQQPFTNLQLAWEAELPQLAAWLRAQSLEHAEQFQLEPWLLTQAPPPFADLAHQAQHLTRLAPLGRYANKPIPEVLLRGIPGRKLEQIKAFAACLPAAWQGSSWLDWCAGKGYLGRYLAWPRDCLCCIEHDAQLINQGEQLSQHWQLVATHQLCDALSEQAAPYLASNNTWVALHACGDLHTHLLRQVSKHQVQRLAIAPCCYNRCAATYYQPLSSMGKNSSLKLDKQMLGLALQATVTAGASEVRQRNLNMAWRLGFDLLQRQWRNKGEYLPLPSSARRCWPHKDFAQWCQIAAAHKNITMQNVQNWQQAEQAGWQRLAQVRNLELVAALFRRPLELWLLLDMALWLEEQGFAVQVGEFCPPQLTPRNLMLLAQR